MPSGWKAPLPKKRKVGTATFRRLRPSPCPACLDRNALNLLGLPIFWRGQKLTGGCELCKGSGRVTEAELVGDWPPGEKWVLR